MKNIIIFATGGGSNAKSIIEYFKNNNDISVSYIISNKADAGVLKIAAENNIPSKIIKNADLSSDDFIEFICKKDPALIVLAGYLQKIPEQLISHFNNKIINIHPGLLPEYGGKGMHGMNVHTAVIKNKEKLSGVTIHFVNKDYDKGNIITQEKCEITVDDTPESLAAKILKIEHKIYPQTIENILNN